MTKLGNIIWKGVKIGAHVVAGSLAFGLMTSAENWHPSGPIGLLWNAVGSGAAGAAIGALWRWAAWDPTKAGK